MSSRPLLLAAAPALAATLFGTASADAALVLSYETTNPSGSANVQTGAGFVNVLGAPSTTSYGNTFTRCPHCCPRPRVRRTTTSTTTT